MEREEYERMDAIEDRMWWYRGLRTLASGLLGRALSSTAVPGAVLDAGAGTGGMLRFLGPAVAGRPTVGLEYDRLAAAAATVKSARPIVVASVNQLPLGDRTLAGYLSLDVLCHGNVDQALALKEAHRCLNPGAIALFNLPAYSWLLSGHDRRVHNVCRFTRGEATALLARHGFRVLRSTYWNTLLFPLMLLHRLFNRDDAQSDVHDYPRWLDAVFSTALAVERAAIGAGLSLPFGGSIILVAVRND